MLLVDDDPDVRTLLSTALRLRGGFEVVGQAENGEGGADLAARLRPDVLVLDLGLPDLAGSEVLVRVRATSPSTRVMIFSGSDTADRAWISRQAEGFMLKDEDLGYLIETLEQLGTSPRAEAATDVSPHPASVGAARRFVLRTLSDWRLDELADDAQLLVSELVTNAIVHGEGSCHLRLALRGDTLRLEVVDGGAGSPEPRRDTWRAEHGRGLHLVNAIATAWGMEPVVDDGKRVWADLTLVGASG